MPPCSAMSTTALSPIAAPSSLLARPPHARPAHAPQRLPAPGATHHLLRGSSHPSDTTALPAGGWRLVQLSHAVCKPLEKTVHSAAPSCGRRLVLVRAERQRPQANRRVGDRPVLGLASAGAARRLVLVKAEAEGKGAEADGKGEKAGRSKGWFRLPWAFGKEGEGDKDKEKDRVGEKDPEEQETFQFFVHATPAAPPPEDVDVVVIGSGLAGLAASRALHKAGVPFVLLEASDGVGGRVRTDKVDGFLLDRGFQIFLTAYPEAKAALDYEALDLKPFYAGAVVRLEDGSFNRVADPFRHPLDGVASLPNPIGSLADKLKVGLLRLKVVAKPYAAIWTEPETTILQSLQRQGFSSSMIDRFFRPFLGGIFFDRELSTTSRLLEFVIKMLALGSNTLPAAGIGAIPQQLASQLPESSIKLNSPVRSIKLPSTDSGAPVEVHVQGGKVYRAKYGTIVAVEQPMAEKLLGSSLLEASPSPSGAPRSTVCLYFASRSPPPFPDPVLYLNGTPDGVINNLCFPSTVAPGYAPPGQTLVSVSLVGTFNDVPDDKLRDIVLAELSQWFPDADVASWRHLRTYRIPFAQPDQRPPTDLNRPAQVAESVFVCGDHRKNATFNGTLASGRLAGQAVAARAVIQKQPQPQLLESSAT